VLKPSQFGTSWRGFSRQKWFMCFPVDQRYPGRLTYTPGLAGLCEVSHGSWSWLVCVISSPTDILSLRAVADPAWIEAMVYGGPCLLVPILMPRCFGGIQMILTPLVHSLESGSTAMPGIHRASEPGCNCRKCIHEGRAILGFWPVHPKEWSAICLQPR